LSATNKVYITGMSALTPTGLNLTQVWDSILNGKNCFKNINGWDLTGFNNSLGGEFEDLNIANMLPDKKLKKVISKQDAYGINAAMQAIEQSKLLEHKEVISKLSPKHLSDFEDDCGVFVGSPGNKYLQQYDFLQLIAKSNGDMKKFAEQLFNEVHPMWLLKILPNNVLAYIGITYGFKGVNQNITNHAVSGTQAIIEAYHAIKTNQISKACVVGYDLGIEPQAIYYYDKLGVLSKNDLKPFDKQHDGTILSEGAGALILESEESANERGALCYAEVIGGQSKTESCGLFSIEENGNELKQLLLNTLHANNLTSSDIDFIVAHGNGNQKSDVSEARAIVDVFNNTPVTGFKWSMGHTLCASGVIDSALAVMALQNKCIPGISNLKHLASDCQGLNVSNKTRPLHNKISNAMIINRGFAAMDTCLLIKSCL
jgi:3-oxoacyl-[acyl-carrier-protein] synthase-1